MSVAWRAPSASTTCNFDLVIQPARRALADSIMVAQQLMPSPYVLVASPQLNAEAGMAVDSAHMMEWPTIG